LARKVRIILALNLTELIALQACSSTWELLVKKEEDQWLNKDRKSRWTDGGSMRN
jgi:hypothetical protein